MPSCEAADRLPRGAPCGRIEAGRRLVEEDQLGVADERQREVQPPQLPAGERSRAGPACSSRPTIRAPRRGRAGRVEAGPVHDRLANLDVPVHAAALQHDADPLAQLARARTGRGRAPRRSRRSARGSPRGSRPSSSSRRRSARAARTPRRWRPRSRCPRPPRACRRSSAGRGRGSRARRESPRQSIARAPAAAGGADSPGIHAGSAILGGRWRRPGRYRISTRA